MWNVFQLPYKLKQLFIMDDVHYSMGWKNKRIGWFAMNVYSESFHQSASDWHQVFKCSWICAQDIFPALSQNVPVEKWPSSAEPKRTFLIGSVLPVVSPLKAIFFRTSGTIMKKLWSDTSQTGFLVLTFWNFLSPCTMDFLKILFF